MTLNTAGYTVGANQPLRHARILWDPIIGTVTADGTNGALATNDFTDQRWALAAGVNNWTLQTAANANVDCVFIVGHNLAGKTVLVQTSVDLVSAFTTRATVVPADNSAIAVMFNTGAGAPHTIRRLRIQVSDGTGVYIAIIRAGVALQMQQPFYGGHRPLNHNREKVFDPQISEGGQRLGAVVRYRTFATTYHWTHLTFAWYSANMDPLAAVLPERQFGIIGNPQRLGDADVGWCWTQESLSPELMGVLDYCAVSLPVMGYGG